MTSTGRTTMRVAVECSRLGHDMRGIGRYVRALLPRLLASRAELQLVPFVRRRSELDELRRALATLVLPTERVEASRYSELRAGDADLWWYPWNIARPAPASGRVVATMHDVAPLVFPDPRHGKWLQNRRWRRLYRRTAERATVILTPSRFTSLELQRCLDVPPERIHVTPLAADDLAVPPPTHDASVLDRLGIRTPYVLAVSAVDRRKNLALLDAAMVHVADLLPSATLVMIGARPSSRAARDPGWLRWAGFVAEEDLASLYREARALVVPSLYEGFGLPVLEAMRMGAPVICARTSSLPEVAGDAALYVSPTDERPLALAILQLLTNDVLYDSLRRAGVDQAARFSWNDTALLTLAAFDDALGR